ncbi:MAG: hypothetical protein EOP60_18895, partial [Sphingomonadales bacterium]
MPIEPVIWLIAAAAALAGLVIATQAALKGWQAWLNLRRLEIEAGRNVAPALSAASRIELADLRERLRKLEA